MELKLNWQAPINGSKILLREGSLHSIIKESSQESPLILFYDDRVPYHHIEKILERNKIYLSIAIKACESNKSREEKHRIENLLLSAKVGKDAIFIALGGGIVCDLVGFIASSYMRGVELIYLPSTLLCMVDACVGGKTAINALGIKNCIGAFYPASQVIIDPLILSSSSEQDLLCGMAEVIKYGLIWDKELFDDLMGKKDLFLEKDLVFLKQIIKRSLEIKLEITTKDPYEKDIRRALNFGHTVAHAIESKEDYGIKHGHAVAMGMCVEAVMSHLMGLLDEDHLISILTLIQSYGFDIAYLMTLESKSLHTFMMMDKKKRDEHIRFTPLAGIGRVALLSAVFDLSIFDDALRWLQQEALICR